MFWFYVQNRTIFDYIKETLSYKVNKNNITLCYKFDDTVRTTIPKGSILVIDGKYNKEEFESTGILRHNLFDCIVFLQNI